MNGDLPEHASGNEAIAVWERHFREPEASLGRAQTLANDTVIDAPARAWCELTIAFHHLFFTAHPLEARRHLDAAATRFAAAHDRRGELLVEIGAARLAIGIW